MDSPDKEGPKSQYNAPIIVKPTRPKAVPTRPILKKPAKRRPSMVTTEFGSIFVFDTFKPADIKKALEQGGPPSAPLPPTPMPAPIQDEDVFTSAPMDLHSDIIESETKRSNSNPTVVAEDEEYDSGEELFIYYVEDDEEVEKEKDFVFDEAPSAAPSVVALRRQTQAPVNLDETSVTVYKSDESNPWLAKQGSITTTLMTTAEKYNVMVYGDKALNFLSRFCKIQISDYTNLVECSLSIGKRSCRFRMLAVTGEIPNLLLQTMDGMITTTSTNQLFQVQAAHAHLLSSGRNAPQILHDCDADTTQWGKSNNLVFCNDDPQVVAGHMFKAITEYHMVTKLLQFNSIHGEAKTPTIFPFQVAVIAESNVDVSAFLASFAYRKDQNSIHSTVGFYQRKKLVLEYTITPNLNQEKVQFVRALNKAHAFILLYNSPNEKTVSNLSSTLDSIKEKWKKATLPVLLFGVDDGKKRTEHQMLLDAMAFKFQIPHSHITVDDGPKVLKGIQFLTCQLGEAHLAMESRNISSSVSYQKPTFVVEEPTQPEPDITDKYIWIRGPDGVPVMEHKYKKKVLTKCFTGSELVAWLKANPSLLNQKQTDHIGQELVDMFVLRRLSGETSSRNKFVDGEDLYRFQMDEDNGSVLNMRRLWIGEVTEPSQDIEALLQYLLQNLSTYISSQSGGYTIDLDTLRGSSCYTEFSNNSAKLQRIDVLKLSPNAQLAFWVNVFNIFVIHINIQHGAPGKSKSKRQELYNKVYYRVGGYLYSLDDIYHGILRGNKKNPNTSKIPFKVDDPRMAFVLKEYDMRIHCALNHLTRSSPPIVVLRSTDLDKTLTQMCVSYFNQAVEINLKQNTIVLPAFFNNVKSDFGKDMKMSVQFINKFLEEEKRKTVNFMLMKMKDKDVKVKAEDLTLAPPSYSE